MIEIDELRIIIGGRDLFIDIHFEFRLKFAVFAKPSMQVSYTRVSLDGHSRLANATSHLVPDEPVDLCVSEGLLAIGNVFSLSPTFHFNMNNAE